jgi:hypothetical protein
LLHLLPAIIDLGNIDLERIKLLLLWDLFRLPILELFQDDMDFVFCLKIFEFSFFTIAKAEDLWGFLKLIV